MTLDHGLALAALIAAHCIRAARQANLFGADERPKTVHLLVGLSLGYVVNTLLPLRLGEVARGAYVAMRSNLAPGRVFATIVAERLSDLVVVVAGLALMAAVAGRPEPRGVASLGLGLGLVAVVAAIWASRRFIAIRRALWRGASVFNDRIRLNLVDFVWSTARLVLGPAMFTRRYLALTLAMWATYLAAYAAFSRATGYPLAALIAALVDSPLRPLLERSRELGSALVLFTSAAALVILIVGIATDWRGIERSAARLRRFGLPLVTSNDPLLRNAFVSADDRATMLRSHFTATDPIVASFGQFGLDAAIVHRILPGGSDAITAVVEVGGRYGIRKFATGDAAAKLIEQAHWLDRHAGALPCATVSDRSGDSGRFRYDMPYFPTARDLYEVVHTRDAPVALGLLDQVVAGVAAHHAATAAGACAAANVERYVDRKIVANARAALDFVRCELADQYTINGQPFALTEWAPLLDRDWLLSQLTVRDTAAIHGDLTFENIVICPEHTPGWYLIDPNPDNLFNSPLIDWAKLLQSLRLGYETLNRGSPARLHGDAITLMLAQSSVYAGLHDRYRALLARHLGPAALREVTLHEIVNYLRLIPYKLRRQPGHALSFFACASLLLRDYRDGEHG